MNDIDPTTASQIIQERILEKKRLITALMIDRDVTESMIQADFDEETKRSLADELGRIDKALHFQREALNQFEIRQRRALEATMPNTHAPAGDTAGAAGLR